MGDKRLRAREVPAVISEVGELRPCRSASAGFQLIGEIQHGLPAYLRRAGVLRLLGRLPLSAAIPRDTRPFGSHIRRRPVGRNREKLKAAAPPSPWE